jgi:signal transduction histidine kinase
MAYTLPLRKFLLCLLLFCMAACTGFAQSKKHVIDSLLSSIAMAPEDSNKVKLYNGLVRIYYQNQSDSFFTYGHKALDLSRKIQWQKGIANATNNLGLLISDTGNHTVALQYLEESLLINRALDAKLNITNNLTNIGRIYYRQGDFPKASTYFFDALKIAEQIQDHEKIAMVSTNLAATFCSQKDFVKGEKYALLNLKHSALANAPVHTFKAYIALGEIKGELRDTAAAKTFYEKALQVAEENQFTLSSAEALSNLAKLTVNYDSALSLAMRALKIYETMSPSSLNAVSNLGDIGSLYLALYQSEKGANKDHYLERAEFYFSEKVRKSRALKYTDALALGLQELAKIYAWKKDYRQAYAYSEQYHAINDSLYSQETKNKLATLEGQREVALRDKEIELNKQALAAQRQQQLALLVGLVLLAVIGALLYWQNRMRKTTNARLLKSNYALDEANKTKAKFFAILSHDLRAPIARLITFLNLQKAEPEMFTKEQVADHHQKITTSAETLLDNMENLLLWSKAQMEQFRPSMQLVPVDDLFAQVQTATGAQPNVVMTFLNPDNVALYTDINFVRTILQNLTNNALNALNDQTEARIEWKAVRQGNKTLLAITDNGQGMRREVLEGMFNTQAVTGTKHGFGSHIIKDLAQAIQCDITVESEPGRGTTVVLSFPNVL